MSEIYVDGFGRDRKVSVVFMYKVDGHYYSGTYSSLLFAPAKGDAVTLRYDPDDPDRNNLVEKDLAKRWIVGVLIVLAVIGILLTHSSTRGH